MPVIKANLSHSGRAQDITTLVGAKTITNVQVYRHGVVTVFEILFSDASVNFIKVGSNGRLEVGGTTPEMKDPAATEVKW